MQAQEINIEKLFTVAADVNNEKQLKDKRMMMIGYLVANTSLLVPKICEIVEIKSPDYLWENLFARHKDRRDKEENYQSRYFILCEKMGTKNRL
jgi:hypothetical protein